MDVFGEIVEKRKIDGRHDGKLFVVEAWLRANSDAFVHRVDVDGIPVPAGHLLMQHGMNAALDAGANLARDFIDQASL